MKPRTQGAPSWYALIPGFNFMVVVVIDLSSENVRLLVSISASHPDTHVITPREDVITLPKPSCEAKGS